MCNSEVQLEFKWQLQQSELHKSRGHSPNLQCLWTPMVSVLSCSGWTATQWGQLNFGRNPLHLSNSDCWSLKLFSGKLWNLYFCTKRGSWITYTVSASGMNLLMTSMNKRHNYSKQKTDLMGNYGHLTIVLFWETLSILTLQTTCFSTTVINYVCAKRDVETTLGDHFLLLWTGFIHLKTCCLLIFCCGTMNTNVNCIHVVSMSTLMSIKLVGFEKQKEGERESEGGRGRGERVGSCREREFSTIWRSLSHIYFWLVISLSYFCPSSLPTTPSLSRLFTIFIPFLPLSHLLSSFSRSLFLPATASAPNSRHG